MHLDFLSELVFDPDSEDKAGVSFITNDEFDWHLDFLSLLFFYPDSEDKAGAYVESAGGSTSEPDSIHEDATSSDSEETNGDHRLYPDEVQDWFGWIKIA
jgi:hypothetical protein